MVPQKVVVPDVQLVTVGTQPGARQTCLVGSQTWPAGHAPQSRVCPQPSPMVPQYWPAAEAHVSGVQVALPQI
jgi:hypothetical protein